MGNAITVNRRLSREDKLRARLEQERNELERRILRAENLFRETGRSESSLLDDVSHEKEDLIKRASHCRQRLRTVNQTLRRLSEGNFGICAECDERISPKRLDAMPTAEYCITCQQQLEESPSEFAAV